MHKNSSCNVMQCNAMPPTNADVKPLKLSIPQICRCFRSLNSMCPSRDASLKMLNRISNKKPPPSMHADHVEQSSNVVDGIT